VFLAAGCAGGPGGAQAGSGGSGGQVGISTSATATPGSGGGTGPAMPGIHLPAGSTVVAGNKVDASGLPAGYPREVWTTGDGTTVGFFGQKGGCSTLKAGVVGQTSAQVTIRLVQQKSTSPRGCPMYIANTPMTVTLQQPLGSREVVLQQVVERG
jgi:hypothetical protein